MKTFFKKKAVKIILIVLGVLLVAGIIFTVVIRNKTKKQMSEFSYTRTVTLSKSSLEETVVASGIIESQTTSTITSSVNNASVSKINYAVGDYVQEGDVIIELDTTNLNKQITKQKEKITDQEEQLQDKYDTAVDDYGDAEDAYENAKAVVDNAYAALIEADSKISKIKDEYDNAKNAYDNEMAKHLQDPTYEIEQEYITILDNAEKELKTAKDAVGYDTLEKNYNTAVENKSKAKSTKQQAENTLDNATDTLNEGVDTESLDDLYDTVADYKLKAKSSGQITNISAVLGNNASGTLATIQDTSKLKIALTIDEYDIFKIELGMKARIETDASDIVYDGVVSQISPVASSGGMGSSGGFEIEVQVTSEDVSKLLIGMNAEVTIIIDAGDTNYNVPIDAVEDKSNGTSVIYVRNDNGEFEEVVVTKGKENGYYVEIFGDDLYEGMVVRASANADEANVSSEEMETAIEEGGFDFGGMPGGGMPGGGNMPNFQGGGGMPSGGPGR